jgi:hypothetical protein
MRSGMSGGFPDRGIPPEYDKSIGYMWPIGDFQLSYLFPGFIGHADNQLGGVQSHIKKIAAKLGVSAGDDDKTRRRLHVGLGIAAGVLVVGSGILLASTRK